MGYIHAKPDSYLTIEVVASKADAVVPDIKNLFQIQVSQCFRPTTKGFFF